MLCQLWDEDKARKMDSLAELPDLPSFFISFFHQEGHQPQLSAQVWPRQHHSTLGRAPGTQAHVLEELLLTIEHQNSQVPFQPGGSSSKLFPLWRLLSGLSISCCRRVEGRSQAIMTWMTFVFSQPILFILSPFSLWIFFFSVLSKCQLPS